ALVHRAGVAAFLVRTDDAGAVPLAVLLQQVGRRALRTGLGQRPVPRGEGAFRIAVASEEDLPPSSPPLGEVAHLAGRAGDSDGERLAGLALRITGAGHEAPEPAALDDHRPAALLAGLVGGLFLDRHDLAVDFLEVLRVLAVRVAGTGEEAAHLPPL